MASDYARRFLVRALGELLSRERERCERLIASRKTESRRFEAEKERLVGKLHVCQAEYSKEKERFERNLKEARSALSKALTKERKASKENAIRASREFQQMLALENVNQDGTEKK